MKKKKNRKFKLFKFIRFIGYIVILGVLIYKVINSNIKNIYVQGNNRLTDQEIIELAEIDDYPKLFSVPIIKMENKIKMNKLIEDVKVKKNIFGRVDIIVKEYNILLRDETDNGLYLSNGKKVQIDETVTGVPSLINVVDEKVLDSFLKKLNNVSKDVLSEISEIEYKPNEFDSELFLFYMNDGNYVYINTLRLTNINKYEGMLEQLEGKKGILYLDSGNHFEILP